METKTIICGNDELLDDICSDFAKGVRHYDNKNNIMDLLDECRTWNREWDLHLKNNPMNIEAFADHLATKFNVNKQLKNI